MLVETLKVPVGETKKATRDALRETVSRLTPDGILPLLSMCSRIEPAVELVRNRARDFLKKNPSILPGWQLRKRGGKRSIDSFSDALCLIGVVPEDDVYSSFDVRTSAASTSSTSSFASLTRSAASAATPTPPSGTSASATTASRSCGPTTRSTH